MRVVINSMAHVPKVGLKDTDYFLFKRRLTIIPKASGFGNDDPEPIVLYNESKDYFIVPREFYFKFIHDDKFIIDDQTSKSCLLSELKPINLRQNQKDPANEVVRFFKNGGFGGCLNADTGTGKTILALEITRRLNCTAIIKIYKNDLADQWCERIKEFFPSAKIGRIQGDVLDYKNKDFVLAMVQTLVARKHVFLENDILRNSFGLEISDEEHRYASKSWGSTAEIFHCRYRLSLTATRRRKDGCENVFIYHNGDIISKITKANLNPTIYFKETGFKPTALRNIESNSDFSEFPEATQLKILSGNFERINLISSDALRAAKTGRKILVLSKFVEHLQKLKDATDYLISKESLNISTGLYVGAVYTGETRRPENKIKKIEKDLERLKKEFQELTSKNKDHWILEEKNKYIKISSKISSLNIDLKKCKKEKIKVKKTLTPIDLKEASKSNIIFATYKKCEDAFDQPDLDTLFFAMPISDPIQSVGRILREYDKKQDPLVVDYCDQNVNFCKGLRRARTRYYNSKNFNLKIAKQKGKSDEKNKKTKQTNHSNTIRRRRDQSKRV